MRSPRSGGVLATLFRFEIRMLLRDRRTVAIAVVLPLVVFPGVILVTRWVEGRQEGRRLATTLEYAVTGSLATWARELAVRGRALEAEDADTLVARSPMTERRAVAPESLLEVGALHLVIEALSAEEWRALEVASAAEAGRGEVDRPAEDVGGDSVAERPFVPAIRLHYRDDSELSSTAMRRMRAALRAARAAGRDSLLLAAGFPVESEAIARVELVNTATAEREAGTILGLLITPFIVMLMLSGGSIVAADAISGEKERGTLETLLTTAADRLDVVAAKQLAIVAVGVTITVINVLNLLLYVTIGLFDLPEGFVLAASPAGLGVLLLLFAPVTVLIASVLLLVSGYAKTYKEYQIYFFPAFLLLLLPSFAGVLPGIELRSAIVLVPLANVAVAAVEALTDRFDWPFLGLAFLSTAGAAWAASRLTARTLSTERLITASELDGADLAGGPALFPRHVLRWFAVMWSALLVAGMWMGEGVEVRVQVAINLLGIFLGGTLLMLRRYRLDPVEALALRPVRPAVWLAVLIGAPSGLLAGQGVFYLASLVFPVPERMLESFGQFLLPEGLGLGQVLLFLCVLPGVVEELAFRGVLLHGLRRRFHPVALCLVVGAVFGLFHVSLFRLLPTAYLGAVLAGVVLLTGSIFPAMAWHALNNAASLVPAYLGWFTGELPPWSGWVGVAGLAVAFRILWAGRGIYPGVGRPEAGRAAPSGSPP